MTKVIDAENRIIGRLATEIAQEALDGEEVRVVNSEEAVISGDEEKVLEEYKTKYDRGVRDRGPHFPKTPARIIKRTVRGMVPYKKDRGREALSRVKMYMGVPHEFKEDVEQVDTKSGDELQNRNYVKLGKVSRHIGWKPRGEN